VGAILGVVVYLWMGNIYLGLVLAGAMLATMIIAGSIGALIPLMLRYLGFDPALGSGVVVVSLTDILGFLVYLGLGTTFLSYISV
jgi:magnesium transporter